MNTTPRELRFGVLCAVAGPAPWQQRCIERLSASPGVRQVMTVTVHGDDWSVALEQVRTLAPDFVLCFVVAPCPAALLQMPRHGVWEFRFGDAAQDDAIGYWEVHDGEAVSHAMLVRVEARPDSGADTVQVLKEGCLRTRLLSVAGNRAQLEARFTHWPAQVCQALRSDAAGATAGASRVAARRRTPPSGSQRLTCRLRILGRILRIAFRSLFRHDQWNIGIVDRPIETFLDASRPMAVRWLPTPKRSELRADPFGWIRDDRLTILCEHFSYRDNRGFIVALDADDGYANRPVQIGPVPPVHLSYPYLFETGGQLCCMPESSEAGNLTCYAAQRYPDQWTPLHVPLAVPVVDATLFEHGGYWWLAGSEVAPKGANCELHLWYATSVAGPWQPHPCNPVKIDIRSARPAGTPFTLDGALYRPAQDCSTTYGARVVINEVVTLTPDEFAERPTASVDPDPSGPWPDGLHTLSRAGNVTLIDGKRASFAPPEFARLLGRWLRAPFRRRAAA